MPDFTKKIDESKFAVPDAEVDKAAAGEIAADTGAIKNDWSAVDKSLGEMTGVSDYFQKAAEGGPGATAASEVAQGQENLGEAGMSSASLGAAFAKIAKGGAKQAGEQQAAARAQSMQFASEAKALKRENTNIQMAKTKAELTLQNSQFAITHHLKQATDGLALAQQQLKSMLNQALLSAKGAGDLAQLQQSQASMERVFSYIQAGLGAGSSVAAEMARGDGATATGGNPAGDAAKAANYGLGPTDDGGVGSASATGNYGLGPK